MRDEIKERLEKIGQGIVPEGYKESKVGIIPEDWKVRRVREIFDVYGGESIPRDKLGDIGYPYLHYGDIHLMNKTCIDIGVMLDLFSKYDIPKEKVKDGALIENGDMVFADASEDYTDIGKAVVIKNERDIPFVSGLHTIIAKDKDNIFNIDFKRFLFNTHNIKKEFKFYATGTSVLGITLENIKKVFVYIPFLKEQEEIANILSTWDKAIEKTEQLIQKKEVQKKGLMQLLLTGKTRLPGFTGEWKIKKLGEISKIVMGQSPKSENYNDEEIGLPLIQGNADMKLGYTSPKTYTSEITKTCDVGDIIMSVRAPVGALARSKHKACIGRGVCCISQNEYIYYYLLSNNSDLRRYSQGSTFEAISGTDLRNLSINIPPLLEQKAIVGILATTDLEIELLKRLLSSRQQQKKGLMQLLLTGIVRV